MYFYTTTTCTNLLGPVPRLLGVPTGYVESVVLPLQPVETVLAAVQYLVASIVVLVH